MYKLLALDLDDTLLEKYLTVPPTTAIKLRALQAKGIGITLATGRMFPSAQIYARELALTLPLVTYNGAIVRAAAADTPLIAHLLPTEKMRQVIKCCKEHHWYLQFYNDDQIIVEKISNETRLDPDMKNVSVTEVGNFLKAELKPSPKMMTVQKPEDIASVKAILEEATGRSLYMTGSKSYLLEIMSPKVSKAVALAELATKLGIDRSEVIAVGDSSNDLEMVKWAGLGVAVANATDELKAAAGYITAAPRSQGIEELIDKLFPGV